MNATNSSTPISPLSPNRPGHRSIMGGFQWQIEDTIATIGMAMVIIVAYYPMTIQGKIPLDRDTLHFFYPLLSFFNPSESLLWNPYQLGGCSFAANPQAALCYPPNWIFFFLPLKTAYILSTVGHYYIAALGMYLLARFSKLSVLSSLVAAFVFCLGGYMSSRLLLRPLMLSAAWFPYVFLCYLYAHYRKVLLGYLFAGVFLALQVLTGMPHNAVYSAIALGVFAIYESIVNFAGPRPIRSSVLYLMRYAGFILIALLLSSVVILPTMTLLPHTVRTAFDFEAATTGSLPWKWLPDIFTGACYHQTRTVGWEFNESNCYLGVIAIWLILFALSEHWRKGIFWFYVVLVIISLAFALGSNSPVFRIFYHFPYLQAFGVPTIGRLFDIPSRFLGLTGFSLAILAGYGMQALANAATPLPSGRPNPKSKWLVALLAIGCVVWIVILGHMGLSLGKNLPKLMMNPTTRGELGPRYAFANFGLFTLAFAFFTSLYLLGYLRQRLFQLLLIFCLVADLMHNASQVGVEFEHPEKIYKKPLVVRQLLERSDTTLRTVGIDVLKTAGGDIFYTRQNSILTPKLGLYYRVQDVSGYDPLILKRYSELVDRMVGIAPGETPLRVVAWAQANSPLLDLMRIGYVIGEVHEIPVFRGEMELRKDEQRRLRLEMDRPCDEIRFRSVVTGGHLLKENSHIGNIVLRDATGEELTFPIRVGRGKETADLFAEAVHSHHPATAFRTWSKTILGKKIRVHNYVCRLKFPRTFLPVEMEFSNHADVMLAILGVSLKQTGTGRFSLHFENRMDRIYKNNTVLPRAWWVHETLVEPSDTKLVDMMTANRLPDGNTIDYRNMALLEKEPAYSPAPSKMPDGGKIEYVEWKPGKIVLDVETDSPGLLVLSEMNYPGWAARVYPGWQSESDGQTAEIMPTNYILRGISLPAGKHRIEMAYRPRSLYFSLMASLLTLALIVSLFIRYRRQFPIQRY